MGFQRRGITRYPDVLNYLADNSDWMNNLGDAFLNQPGEVMNAVQSLRAEANAAGNLVSNERQQVICDGDLFEIVPANPDTIYVPVYDPESFTSTGLTRLAKPTTCSSVSALKWARWLDRDCDWHDHAIFVGSWGADRPWWHRDVVHDGFGLNVYGNDRPGNFRNVRVTNINSDEDHQYSADRLAARQP